MCANCDFIIFQYGNRGERGSGGVDMRYNYLLLYKYSTKD